MGTVSRKEWIWTAGWAIIILIMTGLPYLYGAVISTAAHQFSGFVIGLEDGHSYLAKMQEGRAGHWLFYLAYTPEPHQPELFFIFYILLGKIAAVADLPNVVLFHLSRWVTIPFGLLAFYYFVAYFTDRLVVRRLALVIFGVSGGLGWLWLLLGGPAELGYMPVDLWVPDASFFLAALTFTHLPLAQGLLLLFVVTGLKFVHHNQRRAGFAAAGCGLLVSLIHPHTLPVITLIFGLHILQQHYAQKSRLFVKATRLALVTLPSLPYLIYVAVVFYHNPAFIAWRLQSQTFSPAPVHYLLGFGVTLLFAIVGLIHTRRSGSGYGFLHIWVLAVPLLVYLPIALQRRFLDGYQAPLAVLAAVGLCWAVKKISGRRVQKGAIALALVLMVLTNVLLVGGAIATIARRPGPVFIAADKITAARWLAERARQDVVLASYQTGNFLPTVAHVRVFVGHGPETMHSEAKVAMLPPLFAAGNDDFRRRVLRDYKIIYLFYGPAERALGDFSPGQAPYLQQVYNTGTVQIYQVTQPYND